MQQNPNPAPNTNAAPALQQAVQNFVVQHPQAAHAPMPQLVAAARGRGRGGRGGRGRGGGGRGGGQAPPAGPPGWNHAKCRWGTPNNFGVPEAQQAVQNADFNQAVYVNTSAQQGRTRQAFTYVMVGGVRICVVGHIHPRQGAAARPGKAYICGFANWEMLTPPAAVQVIDQLPDGGQFPGDNRYPH